LGFVDGRRTRRQRPPEAGNTSGAISLLGIYKVVTLGLAEGVPSVM
jgi:hypothetical protein